MSLFSKKTVEVCYQLITEGWEPTREELENKFFKGYEPLRKKNLTDKLVKRVRRQLYKNDKLYFYCIGSQYAVKHGLAKYRILEASLDRLEITRKLLKVSNGFAKASNSLILDTSKYYPRLAAPLVAEVKAAFKLIKDLAVGATLQLDDIIKKESIKKGTKNEDTNK